MSSKSSTPGEAPAREQILPWLEQPEPRWAHRIRRRNDRPVDPGGECVIYWMQRSQRAVDNPALNVAISAANAYRKPLYVLFCLDPNFPNANLRHFDFMLRGIEETAATLSKRYIGFVMRLASQTGPADLCRELGATALISDESHIRFGRRWRKEVAEEAPVAFFTVDGDVVVPTALFPDEEHAARTIRPKIQGALDRFLVAEPELKVKVHVDRERKIEGLPVDTDRILDALPLDESVGPVDTFEPGTEAGMKRLADFVSKRLKAYPKTRNHPEKGLGTSRLSPYLHFGQLGPRAVALAVRSSKAGGEATQAFLEQLVVRRELAMNFVKHNDSYDRFDAIDDWAKKTLGEHRKDPRPHRYTKKQLESADTHDPLWNAAQKEMVLSGHTHGYARMYWVKKLLEWCGSPKTAYTWAVELNDRYQLDGRDPNGYANIAWGVGGKHDHPWPERPVFGKVRSMTYSSTSKKLDVDAYVRRVEKLEKEK
jgi:deoxyribodipyrimidine photo-lyase